MDRKDLHKIEKELIRQLEPKWQKDIDVLDKWHELEDAADTTLKCAYELMMAESDSIYDSMDYAAGGLFLATVMTCLARGNPRRAKTILQNMTGDYSELATDEMIAAIKERVGEFPY